MCAAAAAADGVSTAATDVERTKPTKNSSDRFCSRGALNFILSTGRLESLQPFNLSVCHNWKAFKTLKNNRKKAGPFSVGTTVAHSDR